MSSNSNTSSSSSGIGFAGLLTVVFIALKLTHYIDWSWWWVLSPLWIGFVLAVVLFVFIVGLYLALPYFREAGTAALLMASASQ